MRKITSWMLIGLLIITGMIGMFIVTSLTVSAYTIHAPIIINSNADFDLAHGVTSGSGTEVDPWVIENLEINGSGSGVCIYIGNTTDHLIIRNCYLHDAIGGSNWKPTLSNAGVMLYNVQNCTLKNNNISSNSDYGVFLEESHNNIIDNNIIWKNLNRVSKTSTGIRLKLSTNTIVTQNTMVDNGLSVKVMNLIDWDTISIDESNTVNGNPVYCWKNKTGGNIPFDAGQVLLANCTDVVVENLSFMGANTGISVDFSKDILIANNTASGINFDISISKSSDNIIINNLASNNNCALSLTKSDGNIIENNTLNIFLYYSSNNVIKNNIASNNFIGMGVYHSTSKNNSIENNIIFANEHGLCILSETCDNTIFNNTISGNKYGIEIDSDNNKIYHNTIINNENQALDSGNNTWDNGPIDGGNFWSDYAGKDTNGDGIGDTSYSIPGGISVDDYPLMYPKNQVNKEPPHSSVNATEIYWYKTSPLNIQIMANDTLNSVSNVTFFYRYSPDNFSWENWMSLGTDIVHPWSWDFEFPDGEGYYEFYSVAIDYWNNPETIPTIADASCAYDSTPPIADAGSNLIIELGDTLIFNRSSSSDNFAIDNYSWFFNYNGSAITLSGVSPEFVFWTPGNYTVTLYVTDAAGNQDMDNITVTVKSVSPPGGQQESLDKGLAEYWWIILIIVVVLIVVPTIMFLRKRRSPPLPES